MKAPVSSSFNTVFVYLLTTVFAFFFSVANADMLGMTNQFSTITIEVKNKQLQVEYADTWELRAQGLQDRKSLCEQCGMLFHFGNSRQVSMWMKDTYIPLDVAFINRDGIIVNIESMKPLDTTSIPSKGKVLYALEMNPGWFKANGVNVGDRVLIKEQVK